MPANVKLVEIASLSGGEGEGFPSLYVIYNASFGKSKSEFSVLLRKPGERASMLVFSITLVNPFGRA